MKEERKRILTMLEEGKLTAEEALALFEVLDRSAKTAEDKQKILVNELSTIVQSEEKHDDHSKSGKEKNTQYNHYQSAKEKIVEFVDSAFKKIKNFDLDVNFGKSIDVSHIFQHNKAEVQHIEIDVANGNVTIIPWDQDDIRVECQAQVYRVQYQDEAKSKFLKEVHFEVKGDSLYFLTGQKWLKINTVIYVPQVEYAEWSIRTFNGSVTCSQATINQAKIKTANGKINLSSIKSQRIEAETANGSIELNDCAAKDLEAETLNGMIGIDGEYQAAELQTFNGDIRCKVFSTLCEAIKVKSTTGNIDISIPETSAVKGELKSNLGSFTIDLDSIQIVEEKSELIQKMMSFQSDKDSLHPVDIQADTKTGSVLIHKIFL